MAIQSVIPTGLRGERVRSRRERAGARALASPLAEPHHLGDISGEEWI